MRTRRSLGPAALSIRSRSVAWFGMSPILLMLWLGGCPSPHPTLQVTTQTTETGGTLQITGAGFIYGDPVTLKIESVPGIGTWSSGAGKATEPGGKAPVGTINITVSYSHNQFSTLPGCTTGNNSQATLNVTVTATEDDGSSYGTAPTQVQVANCGWGSAQVTAHQ